jgi:hypothetical protein
MSEQGLPQITNSELIADLEAILLELRDRLNNYLDLGAGDLIAADEGFNFAGQLQATLADAVEHTATPGAPGRDPAQRLLSKWGSGRRAKRLVRRRVREVGPKRIPETGSPPNATAGSSPTSLTHAPTTTSNGSLSAWSRTTGALVPFTAK